MRMPWRGWGVTTGIGVLVIAVLAVVAGVGLWAASHEREVAAQAAFARSVVERAAAAAATLDGVPPERRAEMLAGLGAPGFALELSPEPPRAMRPWRHAGALAEAVRETAPETLRGGLLIQAVAGRPRGRDGLSHPEHWGPGYYTLVVSIPLADGQWLVALAPGHPVALRPGGIVLIALGLATIAAVGFALLVARRMTRPLRLMAQAADRLAADIDAPPLAETGSSEMRRASAAFNRMQERLRRVLDDRTLMLAALSHDLRTVITRLRLRAEEIADEEQRAKALDDLADMETMLREGLDFARGEATREARRKVDLAALVKSLTDDLADAGREVAYRGPEHLVVSCRPTALRRALANLIDNAIRYAGEAEVTLRRAGPEVAVEVADRGPGIPDDDKEAMFRPFMRGEPSRSRATGGTGLGLAVARSILRAHGGDVVLADREGGGLVARAVLPSN